jgi:hypothetical protein
MIRKTIPQQVVTVIALLLWKSNKAGLVVDD